MNSSENNNRAASHDFQTALGLLEERLRSLEDSEAPPVAQRCAVRANNKANMAVRIS